MKLTTKYTLLAACFALSSASQAIVIDNFDDANVLTLGGSGVAPSSVTGSATAAGIIGGERELRLDRFVPGAAVRIETGAQTFQPGDTRQFLRFNSDNPPASGMVVWDGQPVGDANNTIDFTGLGGVDLTDGGTDNALSFELVSADPGIVPGVGTPQTTLPVYFFVFTDATNFSAFRYDAEGRSETDPNSLSIAVPFAQFVPQPGSVGVPTVPDFANGLPIPTLDALLPVGPADFTNVGAVVLVVDATVNEGFDFAIDVLETTFSAEGIPVPATAWLMMLVGGLLVGRRRKR